MSQCEHTTYVNGGYEKRQCEREATHVIRWTFSPDQHVCRYHIGRAARILGVTVVKIAATKAT